MQTMLLGKIRRPATSRRGLDAAASMIGREKARRAAEDDTAGAACSCDNDDAGGSNDNCSDAARPRVPQPAGAEPCIDFISADDMRRLDDGELVDLDRLVWIAEYIATKHAEKGALGDVTGQLMSIIRNSAESLDVIEGDVQEMLFSAEASLERIREMHTNMCGDGPYSLGGGVRPAPEANSDAAAGPVATVTSTAGSAKAAVTDTTTTIHPTATAVAEAEPAKKAASCGILGCSAMSNLDDIEIKD
ncbi:MAG: hypothetical protein J4F28_01415 [Nitrosopumilaceae archaeon]|nr:hypothetical protein [Nitrosopumilaceae archaeon]